MNGKTIDYKLFFIILFLIIFGMVMISSVSVYPSYEVTMQQVAKGTLSEPNNYFYLLRNITHIIIGLSLFAFIVKMPYQFFERNAKTIFIISIILLITVIAVGTTYNGSRGWLNIPFLPFSLQPAEFIKLGLIIYLSYYLKIKRHTIKEFKEGFIQFMGILIAVTALIALMPDFGTILIITPISLILFYVGGGNVKYLGVAALSGLVFALSIYSIGDYDKKTGELLNKLGYITQRVDTYFLPAKEIINKASKDKDNRAYYQIKQGLIAVGSGGFTGLGFGKSIQKFGYLPEVEGDFIFSVASEELGFIGLIIIILLYLTIVYRGLNIAINSDDLFAKYIAVGITSWITIQAFINIGVNLNIVPLTGVTLPFVSYGGSSLISLLIGVGILLNISRHTKESGGIINNRGFKRNLIS